MAFLKTICLYAFLTTYYVRTNKVQREIRNLDNVYKFSYILIYLMKKKQDVTRNSTFLFLLIIDLFEISDGWIFLTLFLLYTHLFHMKY